MKIFQKIKSVLFPFFNINFHAFLIKKWWFRLLIVLYIIGIIIILGAISSKLAYSSWGWCYNSSYLYIDNNAEYVQHLDRCAQFLSQERLNVILVTILLTAIIHYIIQFIFFKIVINFIVLGSLQKE